MMSNGSPLPTKISGYLDKKGKLRIGSSWKKYWFVLEGRLLLYYRSKDEYEAISPCKGSINLCPPCTIKPTSGTACIFQIECRATTVTLRAESRSEQERWMQALLTAIAQTTSSPNRMSHFRYSLDELPIPAQESKHPDGLQRQNTLPYSTALPKKDIIDRLQLIGAHTYGGSLGAITKFTPKVQHVYTTNDVTSHKTSSSLANLTSNEMEEPMIENDEYSMIQEENSLDVFLDEQASAIISTQEITTNTKEVPAKLNQTHLVENDQYAHSNAIIKMDKINGIHNTHIKKSEQTRNVKKDPTIPSKTYFVENEQYCHSNTDETNHIRNKQIKKSEPLYERISSDSNKFNTNEPTGLIRTNSNVYERISSSSDSSEMRTKIWEQYSAVKKSSQESIHSQQEAEYSMPINLEDFNKNNVIVDNDEYMQDQLNDNEYYKVDQVKELEELYEDPDALRKKNQFEPLLPPRPDIKKQDISEESCSQYAISETRKRSKAFQLLAQLIKFDKKEESNNKFPRTKKKRTTSFIHRMLTRKAKSVDSGAELVYDDVIDYNTIEKPKEINDTQMLQELQKILEARKSILQKKLKVNEEKVEDEHNLHRDKISDDINILTQTEDLDKETGLQESKKKVKDLIEKFNDLQNEEEVSLRRKCIENLERSESGKTVFKTFYKLNIHEDSSRDSDELTRLLEELSKVTCAPILTPGATSSLTTPILTDDEWLKLIPIRNRRLSEPDYDVPRSHGSLQLRNRIKHPSINAIPATRFFGPVLSSPVNISTDTQSLSSMDADSLELIPNLDDKPNPYQIKCVIRYGEKESSISSYSSHNYSKPDEVIYLQPKLLLKNKQTNFQNDPHMRNHIYSNHTPLNSPVSEEIYIDSLETVAESSTTF